MLARGTVAKGLLISKPAEDYLNYNTELVEKVAKAISNLSSEGRSAESIAIQYVLGNRAVTSAVVGIRTSDQLKSAVDSIYTRSLSETERKKLSETIPTNIYDNHR